MKKYAIAAVVIATSTLGGCASNNGKEQAAAEPNPCLGVRPSVGTTIVKKEDCGGAQPAAGPGSAHGVPGQMQRK